MDNNESIKWEIEYPTTRMCLVCESLENPKANIANGGLAWLCPECKSRIKKLLYPKEG